MNLFFILLWFLIPCAASYEASNYINFDNNINNAVAQVLVGDNGLEVVPAAMAAASTTATSPHRHLQTNTTIDWIIPHPNFTELIANNTVNDTFFLGREECPCLFTEFQTRAEFYEVNIDDPNSITVYRAFGIFQKLGITTNTEAVLRREELLRELQLVVNNVTLQGYGYGCAPHDLGMPSCHPGECLVGSESLGPYVQACDQSFCQRSWCLINPLQCKLHNSLSLIEPRLYRSYATCDESPQNSGLIQLSAIVGKVYRVAYVNSNLGWKRAYNLNGESFSNNTVDWSGPIVEFVAAGAKQGRFQLDVDFQPDEQLRFFATDYYNTTSNFDLCTYAVQMGLLDFCVGGFTITSGRSVELPWMSLFNQPLTVVSGITTVHTTSSFWQTFSLVLAPLSRDAWLFIFFFVLPVTGMLMLFHDYRVVGSTYPLTRTMIKIYPDGTEEKIEKQVPLYVYFIHAYYTNMLSLFEVSLGSIYVNLGAKLTLLGFDFFVFMFAAVYTANLAAILAQGVVNTDISTLDDVINNNYRICIVRRRTSFITSKFPGFQASQFVVDPADNRAGFFDQPGNPAAPRVLNQLDFRKAQSGDKRYCHAAIVADEDLLVAQSKSNNCNLVAVGDALLTEEVGIPMYEPVSRDLIPFFTRLRKEGRFFRALNQARPQPACPGINTNTPSLGMYQMSGVWCITFMFVGVGLLAKWYRRGTRAVRQWVSTKTETTDDDYVLEAAVKKDQHFMMVDVREKLDWEDAWKERNEALQRDAESGRCSRRNVGKRSSSFTVFERFAVSSVTANLLSSFRQVQLDDSGDDEVKDSKKSIETKISSRDVIFENDGADGIVREIDTVQESSQHATPEPQQQQQKQQEEQQLSPSSPTAQLT